MRRTFGIILIVVLTAGIMVPGSADALVGRDASTPGTQAYDVRATAPGLSPTRAQGDAILALVREAPSVRLRWNRRFGTPSAIIRYDDSLSAPVSGSPDAAARAWLGRHAALFGWDGIAGLDTVKTLTQPNGGSVAVLYHQRFGTLEGGSLGGSLMVGLDRDNRILSVRANVVRTARLAAGRGISARAAFAAVAGVKAPRISGSRAGWTVIGRGPFVTSHYARRIAFPVGDGAARPAWEVLFIKAQSEAYRTVVDALTGAVLYRESLVASEAPEGRVFRNYPGAKLGGRHELVSFKGDPAASPQGWFSPVSSSAPALTTMGNNATTATNWLVFIAPDGPGQLRPVSATGVFDYAFTDAWRSSNCGSNPISDATGTVDTPAYAEDALPAVTNLFYHHNVMHDFFYNLGFNEAAGNLQVNNFGKGGLQEDPIIGLVQAGAVAEEGGRDNAYMLTLPDGLPSWSGMFLFEPIANSFVAPCADGDFDAPVIYHEYTHAVSSRWVGGEWGNLGGHQGGSMGEAWSDFYALHYLHKHRLETTTALGPYVTGDLVQGIRNYPVGNNPLTYGDMGYDLPGPEVHSDGEIWAATLWDIRTALANARPGGADLAAQLIADAMPISGPMPDMLDMRNAILAADRARTNGANQELLWRVFAKRGMGAAATTTDSTDASVRGVSGFNTDTDPVPAYNSGIKAQNGTVVLHIVDRDTGAPVTGAKLFLTAFEIGAAPVGRTATDGTISLTLAAGTYSAKIVTKGYGSRTIPVVATAGRTTDQKVAVGVNYASSGAGARVVTATIEAALGGPALAIDDIEATTWRPADADGPKDGAFVIDLAGTTPVLIDEIRMSARPLAGSGRFPTLKDWEIQASLDGKTFAPLTKGGFRGHVIRPLASTIGYRSWRLPRPARASFLKVIVKSAQDEEATTVQLAEVQVFGRGPALTVAPPSGSGAPFHAEGLVLGTTADAQLSRNLILAGPCTLPSMATQSIDAYLFELPDGYGDGTHSIRVAMEPLIVDPRADPDAYFYNEDCQETGSVAIPTPITPGSPPEVGLIPQASKYLLVMHYTTLPGTVVVDAAPERVLIPKGRPAPKPKPAVRGERLASTGVEVALGGGLTMLAAAAGVTAWLRPRRRRAG